MDLSRRRMLQGIVALAVTAGTPLRWVARAEAAQGRGTATTSTTTSSWLSRSTYVPLVGTTFTTGRAAMTLSAIRDLPSQPASEGRFSLLFTSGSSFAQGTRTVAHTALGQTELFVVPIGPVSSPRSYEVIVNRLK